MPDVTIEAVNLGKDYNLHTIFSQLSGTFRSPDAFAVVGHNGSGKSTLLRVLAGMDSPTNGQVKWLIGEKPIPEHRQYEYLAYCSPLFDFDYRFTVRQILRQYSRVKPMKNRLTVDDLIQYMGFENHQHKYMDELSSGMNQRVRLILTICSDVPVLFLDEPCSNLDQQGVHWYNDLISEFARDKLVFVASNDPREYAFCTEHLAMGDYKIKDSL